MTSHELAKKLLAMPNVRVLEVDSEPKIIEIPDVEHPDFEEIKENVIGDFGECFDDWHDKQPKTQVITLFEL